jgi:lipase chaperone LimK
MAIEVSIPVQTQRDQITKQANDATIKLAELQKAYASSPDMRLERDRAETGPAAQ